MLCLADQVIGHYPGVRRVVGNDPNLSGPGYLINPHSAEQLSLGLCQLAGLAAETGLKRDNFRAVVRSSSPKPLCESFVL